MRKIGGLIAVVLMALLVIVGCDNSTVTNDGNDEWINHINNINNIIANSGSGIVSDKSWYDADASGSQKYTLSNVNQLVGLMDLVGTGVSFEGDTIELVEDAEYDLSSISSVSKGIPSFIGSGKRNDLSSAMAFAGTFDGKGATIKGVNLSYLSSASDEPVTSATEDNTGVGFFGVVKGASSSAKAVVKDLVFEGCTLVSTSNTTGIAVGYAENAEIRGIVVRNCEVIGPQGVGAVVGRFYVGGTISGCTVENTTVKATAAGTVDYSEAQVPGESNGNYNAGGIVGCVKGASAAAVTVSGNAVDLSTSDKIYADYLTAGGICGTSTNAMFNGNTVKVGVKTQISVGDHDKTYYEGAIIANPGSTTKYGSDSDVNKVYIGGTEYPVADKDADNMSTIDQP